jgi:hypothetical protein
VLVNNAAKLTKRVHLPEFRKPLPGGAKMKFQHRHHAHFIVCTLVLLMSGAEVTFAEEIQQTKASFSTLDCLFSVNYGSNQNNNELDLVSLEQRVRSSKALRFSDKIKLKFEVNKLVGAASDFHKGRGNESVRSLRLRFERTLSKAFVLLRKDTELHQKLSSSQEILWEKLLDADRSGETPAPGSKFDA